MHIVKTLRSPQKGNLFNLNEATVSKSHFTTGPFFLMTANLHPMDHIVGNTELGDLSFSNANKLLSLCHHYLHLMFLSVISDSAVSGDGLLVDKGHICHF